MSEKKKDSKIRCSRLRNKWKNNSTYNSLKKPQMPRNKLNKDVNDIYRENFKPLKKEINEN
jgi:hypothetical protein